MEKVPSRLEKVVATNPTLRKQAPWLMGLCLAQSLLMACTDGTGVGDPILTDLAISPQAVSVSGVGTTIQLTAEATDTDGAAVSPREVTWSTLNPNIAVVEAASGLATAVASGQVVIAGEAGGHVAYALLTVSVPDLPLVSSWIPTTLDFTILDVWGTAFDNVFVVGGRSSEPAIAHYDGTSWSEVDLTGEGGSLWSVWGTSATDVYAVGDGGLILHYDGVSWNPMESGVTGGFTGVWAAAPNAVFSVGPSGVLFYDGETWSPWAEWGGGAWWVWGNSRDDAFFYGVGVNNTRGAWGSSPSDLFAVGLNGAIWHSDGNSWTEVESGTSRHLFGVWGFSPSDVYAVGEKGTILHYDGSSWSLMDSGTDQELFAIWGTSSGDVFAVSRFGFLLRGVR